MAEAMIRGILNQKLIGPEAVTASGPRPERAQELRGRYGVRGVTDNCQAARAGKIVVLSVKPQTVKKVLPEIREAMSHDDLVVSIVAGTPIGVLRKGLGDSEDRARYAEHTGPGRQGHDGVDCHA